MFSGIVKGMGIVVNTEQNDDGMTVTIDYSQLPEEFIKNWDCKTGDSIAVNGACLTAKNIHSQSFDADISLTTLSKTNLSSLGIQSQVNLEPALTLNEAVNGHLVSGHIDSTTQIKKIQKNGFSRTIKFKIPRGLSPYIVNSGSVTLDGVSLTVNEVGLFSATVTVVPHTLEHTIINTWMVDSVVNLEVDLLARYVEKLTNNIK